jgi:hypothetical protein
MAIYEISNEEIKPVPQTTFSEQKIRERDDLQ